MLHRNASSPMLRPAFIIPPTYLAVSTGSGISVKLGLPGKAELRSAVFSWEFAFCACGFFWRGWGGARPLLSKEGQKNNRKEGRIMIIPSITPRTIIIITMSILITVAYKCSYYRCIYKEINI